MAVSARPNDEPIPARIKTSRSRDSARNDESRGDKTGRSMADEMDKLIDERKPDLLSPSACSSARSTARSSARGLGRLASNPPSERSFESFSAQSEYTPRSEASSFLSSRSSGSSTSRSSDSSFTDDYTPRSDRSGFSSGPRSARSANYSSTDSDPSTVRSEMSLAESDWGGLDDDQILKKFSKRFVNTLIGNVYQGEMLRRMEEFKDKAAHDAKKLEPKFKRRGNIQMIASQEIMAMERRNNIKAEMEAEERKPWWEKEQAQAQIEIMEIGEFNVDCIDDDIFPSRPYVICKVGRRWSHQTYALNLKQKLSQSLSRSLSTLKDDYKCMIWKGVNEAKDFEEEKIWPHLRIFQDIYFDFMDAASGLLWGKAKVNYIDFVATDADKKGGEFVVATKLLTERNFGHGEHIPIPGFVKIKVNYLPLEWHRPDMPQEHFEQKRAQHWTLYPLTPISTGQVRRKYPVISKHYDRNMLVHPALYGFFVRWRGPESTEGMFIHPMFTTFTLERMGLTPAQKEKIEMEAAAGRDKVVNPYKYDPSAASRGKCPVCAIGASGCPRCFMYPKWADGVTTTPEDFAYNPEREHYEKIAAEEKELQEKLRARRKATKKERKDALKRKQKALEIAKKKEESVDGTVTLETDSDSSSSGSESESDSDEEEGSHRTGKSKMSLAASKAESFNTRISAEGKKLDLPPMHTKLTTYTALRRARENAQSDLVETYIKVMPAGYVRKFIFSPKDTMFYIHQMFKAHVDVGNAQGSKLLLPSSVGIFEMDADIEAPTDLMMKVQTGYDTLGKYGVHENRSTLILLYMTTYAAPTLPTLLNNYMALNTEHTPGLLPIYDNVRHKSPSTYEKDVVQIHLTIAIRKQYEMQEFELKKWYRQLGIDYMHSKDAKMRAMIAAKKAKKLEDREKCI